MTPAWITNKYESFISRLKLPSKARVGHRIKREGKCTTDKIEEESVTRGKRSETRRKIKIYLIF